MERSRNLFCILPIFCLLITYSLFGQAKPNDARLAFVRGRVSISRGTLDELKLARVGMDIRATTRLKTGDDGLAEISFGDGSKLRLTGGTDVRFTMLLHKSAWIGTERDTVLKVSQGTIYFSRAVTDRKSFHVNIKNLWWTTNPGPIEFRASVEGDTALLAVFAGTVSANMAIYPPLQSSGNQAQGLKVGTNESIVASAETGLVKDAARGIGLLRGDTWNKLRDDVSQNTVVKMPSIVKDQDGVTRANEERWYPMCERSDGAILEYTYDEPLLSGVPRTFAVHCTPWVCGGTGVYSEPLSVMTPVSSRLKYSDMDYLGMNGSIAECEKELGRSPGNDPKQRP
jgi:hypothetical protein